MMMIPPSHHPRMIPPTQPPHAPSSPFPHPYPLPPPFHLPNPLLPRVVIYLQEKQFSLNERMKSSIKGMYISSDHRHMVDSTSKL
ncbi:hypothetical protein A2U01_0032357, partial [Trifolium medium]|nr:hypothetical protein [Trifolium medium]